ncbi:MULTISPECIES: ATP-dependent protease ATPase subunit HslU [unclassified Granulicatella]|uniref:ATP-dependent protease ATPase subunit HslU n=1 Tax=unclassified Granulicatella TaxID=2630493 RepID=UPI00107403E5|nr:MULTISPECIES: ATP-dependent protease ATPase subunit HslU [unclassified Granulicatella]MBF0779983.1 ATP-dependent protease ATPase subunit HslU [Granulicatella sp. 19428wC4_WM01]TFU95909.1 ATP-dependent protease ATPase subunit HslU [Granulicatella sp. WM01]
MTTLGKTPRQIVAELDKYIIGQQNAKRAVAVALRNRYRRLQLSGELQKDVTPKNLLMIGSTGVGKTEIARRLAWLVNAPFVKVEATKFTEVGYVGRDVESMVRDLVDASIQIVSKTKKEAVYQKAEVEAIKRIAAALKPGIFRKKTNNDMAAFQNMFKGLGIEAPQEEVEEVTPEISADRRILEKQIASGELDHTEVTIKLLEREKEVYGGGPAMEQISAMQNVIGSLSPRKHIKRTVTVAEAKELLIQEVSETLVNKDDIHSEALKLAESSGIIFIDEIDKITSNNAHQGGQVSREGVQRDILPIVEGSQVMTKYGPIQTDHILFIASGAFHLSKPTDLIPELQGRFPIRVELIDLTQDDFERILTEPNNSLLKQYIALLATEQVELSFTPDAIAKIAEIAYRVNEDTDNIGARRLHTILEKLLEDLLFESPDMAGTQVSITQAYVEEKVGVLSVDDKLKHYIL